jgi:hypothetical protein
VLTHTTHAIDRHRRAGSSSQRPADGPGLLRAVRAGEHPRIHRRLAIITLGGTDELTTLRVYESTTASQTPPLAIHLKTDG